MRDLVLQHVPSDRSIEVLDIGCGTGSLVRLLAVALPLAKIVGVDISSANVRAAEMEAAPLECRGRVWFEHADYLQYQTAPRDLIVTDTVLHFIVGGPMALWTKLARDLRPGGLLVACMAYGCAHNRATAIFRRAMRRLRSRPLDSLLLAMSRLMYGDRMDDARLRERTEYMYIPPEQLMTQAVAGEIAPSLGLRRVAQYEMTGTSVSQLRQRVTVFVKDDNHQRR
jgi:SAM-dependent methyltransferase